MSTRLIDTLIAALADHEESTRLKAALALGSHPDRRALSPLLTRCAVEPDFFVRDMLTWALTRLPQEDTVPRLLAELCSPTPQARAQALHTLSKIKDPSTWAAITPALLRDTDDEVARSAWRAAVVLVPPGQEKDLAEELATQLGRGGQDMQLSLSRALVALGPEVIGPVLRQAMTSRDPAARSAASAADRLLRHPGSATERALNEAKRLHVLGRQAAH